MKFKIYPDQHLLIEILEGDINLQELERIFREVISHPDFVHVNRILSNLYNARLIVTTDEVQQFIKYIITPNRVKDLRWAILTNRPIDTALSFLITQDEYFKDAVNIFSTLEACNLFLQTSVSKEYFSEDDYILTK